MTRRPTHLRGLIPFVALPLFWGCQSSVMDPLDTGRTACFPEGDGWGHPGLSIVPAIADLDVGDYLDFRGIWRDRIGTYDLPLEGIRWVSDDPDIASVTEDGLVRALADGTAKIRAEANGGSAEAMVRVGRF